MTEPSTVSIRPARPTDVPARDFYAAIGATPMHGWLPYRLTGEALHRLAGQPAREHR